MKTIKLKIFAVLILFLTFFLNASYNCNDFEIVFPPDSSTEKTSVSIKYSMIDGATLFFQSYGAANLLLGEGEASDKGFFNFGASLNYVNDAILKLELSRGKYMDAYKQSLITDYVEERINQLKRFDYFKYAVEHQLMSEIMEQVAGYLSKGDVRGFYKKNIDNVDLILSTLYVIRDYLNEGQKPDIKAYWNLLRLYSNALLFGNYATASAREAFNIM